MSSEESIDLWRHVLSCLQPGIWYLVDDAEEEFPPTLCRAISLNAYLYQLLLIDSGVLYSHGENLRFSLRKLDNIKVHIQENLDVRYMKFSASRRQKQTLFCIGVPRFSKAIQQASSRQRLSLQSNQLDGTYLALLHYLSNQHAPEPEPIMMRHVPMLVEEVEEEEGEAEEVVEVLIEEEWEEEERRETEYEPYQLTHYYRNQLEQFQHDYVR
jgi:hypothetical protein